MSALFEQLSIRIKQLIHAQNGSALVPALGALLAVSALGIAATTGVSTNVGESNRDEDTKRALAAAEAGINEAVYRLNMLQPTSSQPCTTLSGSTLALTAAESSGWCAAQTTTVADGTEASYQISPYSTDSEGSTVTRTIVSTGTADGVSRRVAVTTSANTGAPLFAAYGLSSDENLTLSGNATINPSARSNHNIVMSGNATICGTDTVATPGPGYNVSLTGNASVCGSTDAAESAFVMTAVDQGDAVTNNDNGRFFGEDPKTGTVTWSSSTRQLSMSGNSTLTLGGHTYSLCKLTMSGNSQLIVGANAAVRIYIDSPANCGLANNTTQFSMSGNNKLINTSQDPTNLQIYMVGPSTGQNYATFSGNSVSTQMTFYGPSTAVSITGNSASYTGAFVADQITVSGNGVNVSYDSRVQSIVQTTIGAYRRQQFIECIPDNASTEPDYGC